MEKYLIDVSKILDTGEIENIKAEVELDKYTLRASEISAKLLDVHLRLEPAKIEGVDSVLLTGVLKGELTMSCHRCMENYEHPVEIRIEQLFTGKNNFLEESKPIENNEIDLIPVIKEALSLNLPIKFLCAEDCKGICPSCGKNLNKEPCLCKNKPIDVRLQKLGDYFKDENNQGPQDSKKDKK